MATPAASAWHRRRILSERSNRHSTPASASSTANAFQSHHPSQNLQFQQQHNLPQRHSQLPAKATTPQQHLNENVNNINQHQPHPSSLGDASAYNSGGTAFSIQSVLQTLLDPFVNFAHSSVIRVLLTVVVTLSMLHLFRIVLMSSVGAVALRCASDPSSLPTFSGLFSMMLIPFLVIIQLASHFLQTRALDRNPPAKGTFLITSLFTTPIHALLSAYILYGPTLTPHQFFCSTPTSLLPTRNALHTPVLTALTYVPFLYWTVFHLGVYSAPPSPFSKSNLGRLFSSIPQAIITTSIPLIPTTLISVTIATATRPPRSLYASLILTGARTAAALCATLAAVLPHALLRFSQGFYEEGCNALDWGNGSEEEARQILATSPSPPAIRRAFVSLCRAPRALMLPFPPFGDPSGRQWRITLEAVLAPLSAVTTQIREAHHSSNATIDASEFPTRVPLTISNAALAEATVIARTLPTAFELSVQHDSFGVALPTLPYTLALLVLLHDGLSSAVSDQKTSSPTNWLFPGQRMGGLAGFLRKALGYIERMVEERSSEAAVRALKDVIAVCIYRLSFVFQDEVSRFVDGQEPGWDVQATEALRPFLRFEV